MNRSRRWCVRLSFRWFCLLALLSGGRGMAQAVPGGCAADSARILFSGVLYFSPGNADWIERSDYKAVGRFLRAARSNPGVLIRLRGWADTTGTAAGNLRVSARRAAAVGRYLMRQGIDPARIRTEGCGEDGVSAPPRARRVEMWGLAADGPFGEAPALEIRTAGKNADGMGETAQGRGREQMPDSTERVLPPATIKRDTALTTVNLPDTAGTTPRHQPEHQPKHDLKQEPEQVLKREPEPESGQEPEPTPRGRETPSLGRYVGVKTNLAAWAGTIMNMAADVQVGRHVTVELPLMWCPWYVSDKHAVRTFTLQPEVRWWLSEPGEGHFFGLHAHAGWFNVKWNRDRYQDAGRPLLGAGVSYGYVLPFSEHWAGEFTLGAGYANMKHDTYYNIDNGARIDTRTRNYWGITRAGLSVVYRFSLKK